MSTRETPSGAVASGGKKKSRKKRRHRKKGRYSTMGPSTESRRRRHSHHRRHKSKHSHRVRQIGKYVLQKPIGKGGFGVVYQAAHVETGENVAIKEIDTRNFSSAQMDSLRSEIALMQFVRHPCIVEYIGHKKKNGKVYIIMEFVPNGSLMNRVKRLGNLSEAVAAKFTDQMLEGLVYLHAQSVVHRDIKADNLLIGGNQKLKFADFGVAARLKKDGDGDGDDEPCDVIEGGDTDPAGTAYWMAPEIIDGRPLSSAADIWSVGATVIEVLTGKPPYFHLRALKALFRVVNDPHPPLPESVSAECRDFLMRCFQKDPAARPNAHELREDPWIVNRLSSQTGGEGDAAMSVQAILSKQVQLKAIARKFRVLAKQRKDLQGDEPEPERPMRAPSCPADAIAQSFALVAARRKRLRELARAKEALSPGSPLPAPVSLTRPASSSQDREEEGESRPPRGLPPRPPAHSKPRRHVKKAVSPAAAKPPRPPRHGRRGLRKPRKAGGSKDPFYVRLPRSNSIGSLSSLVGEGANSTPLLANLRSLAREDGDTPLSDGDSSDDSGDEEIVPFEVEDLRVLEAAKEASTESQVPAEPQESGDKEVLEESPVELAAASEDMDDVAESPTEEVPTSEDLDAVEETPTTEEVPTNGDKESLDSSSVEVAVESSGEDVSTTGPEVVVDSSPVPDESD